jgi:SAM-dependent methyltransferase
MKTHFDHNQEFWNHRAEKHYDSAFYDNASFIRGRNSLNSIERAIIGDDLSGQRVLHLMCHFGQDTLSLARLGGQVTGVDLSPTAIAKARQLTTAVEVTADFICCNVLEIDQHLSGTFDLIFASYGHIGWLPELTRWGQLIGQYLKPGGRFVLAEFHPTLWMFDDDFTEFAYSYFNVEPCIEENAASYTDLSAAVEPADAPKLLSYYWNHSLADVFQALMAAGLHLSHFSEYDYSPYDAFHHTLKTEQGYQIKGLEGKLPMVFALEAVKQ